MIKSLLLLLAVPSFAVAAPVSFEFKQAGLLDFAETVFKGMLHQDYVISNDVLAEQKKITVNLKNQPQERIYDVVEHTLKGEGVILEKRGGVVFITKQTGINENGATPSNLGPVAPIVGNGASGIGQTSTDSPKHDAVPVFTCDGNGSKGSSEFGSYSPRYRSAVYLSKLVKFLGGCFADVGETSQILFSAESVEILDKIQHQLERFDTKPQAVTIRAALIEFTETNEDSRAVNLTTALSALSSKLGVVYKAGSLLVNNVTFAGHGLQAVFSAIQGDSRFSYLANPVVRVLDGERAKLVVGAEVPTRGNATTDKNGNIIQSTEYRTSGVQIVVEPQIKKDFILLKVQQEISNFQQTTTSQIDSPTLTKRQAETVLDAVRGDLIVLAGLDEDKKSESTTGLSFLPSFLKSKTANKSKSQILLLIEVIDA